MKSGYFEQHIEPWALHITIQANQGTFTGSGDILLVQSRSHSLKVQIRSRRVTVSLNL